MTKLDEICQICYLFYITKPNKHYLNILCYLPKLSRYSRNLDSNSKLFVNKLNTKIYNFETHFKMLEAS